MRFLRKFLEAHFPYFKDETEDFRRWTVKQIVKLGGDPFIPQKQYHGYTRSKLWHRKSGNMSATSSPQAINQEANTMKTIVIDAGHGGHDSGAIGATGKLEKDFNLTMALKVESLLINNPEVTVKLTRSTDVFIELIERAKIANNLKADLFLSIHANSGGMLSPGAGTETLYTRSDSKAFSDHMHNVVNGVTGLKDRKSRYDNLSVCRNTTMPACLIEPGFLSNKTEELLLFDPAFQDKLAEAISKGLCAFLGVPYSISTKPPAQIPGLTAISVIANAQTLTGYLLNGVSWVPARPVLDYLKPTWAFKDKQIILEGVPVVTMLIDNMAYIKSKDLMSIGARVFFDNADTPKRIDIFPKLEATK